MQINIDVAQMMQEQNAILKMCSEHESCVDCPMKTKPVQTQISVWACEHTEVNNAS